MNQKKILFLVDDDVLYLSSLRIEFQQNSDFNVQTFTTGERCIENLVMNPSLIILDYHLDGTRPGAQNGLQTLDQIKAFNPLIPVVVLSSQDKIEVAVNCMRHKAYDYIVKSETAFVRLHKIIDTIFTLKKM